MRMLSLVAVVVLVLASSCKGKEEPAAASVTAPAPAAPEATAPDQPAPAAAPANGGAVRDGLLGTWRAQIAGPGGATMEQTLVFQADGTFQQTDSAGGESHKTAGTFQVVGGTPASFQLEMKAQADGASSTVTMAYALTSAGLTTNIFGQDITYQRQ